MEFLQTFVAFSEYMNFKKTDLLARNIFQKNIQTIFMYLRLKVFKYANSMYLWDKFDTYLVSDLVTLEMVFDSKLACRLYLETNFCKNIHLEWILNNVQRAAIEMPVCTIIFLMEAGTI